MRSRRTRQGGCGGGGGGGGMSSASLIRGELTPAKEDEKTKDEKTKEDKTKKVAKRLADQSVSPRRRRRHRPCCIVRGGRRRRNLSETSKEKLLLRETLAWLPKIVLRALATSQPAVMPSWARRSRVPAKFGKREPFSAKKTLTRGLSNGELDDLARRGLGLRNFAGVFPVDDLPTACWPVRWEARVEEECISDGHDFSMIINLAPTSVKMGHYVALCRRGNEIVYADSYGDPPPSGPVSEFLKKLVIEMVDSARPDGVKKEPVKPEVRYLHERIQPFHSLLCGYYALLRCCQFGEVSRRNSHSYGHCLTSTSSEGEVRPFGADKDTIQDPMPVSAEAASHVTSLVDGWREEHRTFRWRPDVRQDRYRGRRYRKDLTTGRTELIEDVEKLAGCKIPKFATGRNTDDLRVNDVKCLEFLARVVEGRKKHDVVCTNRSRYTPVVADEAIW